MNKKDKNIKFIVLILFLLLLLFVVPNIVNTYKKNKINEMIIQENQLIESAEALLKDYCKNPVSDEKQKDCETYYQELPSTSPQDKKEIITKYVCISDLKKLGYYNEKLKYLGKDCQGVVIYEIDKNTKEELSTYSYIKCANKYTTNINKKIDKKILEECFKDTTSESNDEETNKEYILKFEQSDATTNGTESINIKYNKSLPNIKIPERKYTVTFDYNDKTKENTTMTSTYTFDGYTYNGIKFYESDGTSNKIWPNKFDATFSINWSINDSNKINFPTPTREGYTFDGWYTEIDGGTKVGTGGQKYEPTSDITLFAKWNANKYKITFNTDVAELKSQTKIVTYNSTYGELETPIRIGYTFTGWYTLDGKKITSETKVSNSSNHKLYAKWKANNYTVIFDSNGCETSFSTSKTVTYEQVYGDFPVVSCTGYTFGGWYTTSSDGEKITNQSNVITPSDHTLYAKWIPNSNTKYKVQHWIQNIDGELEHNNINFILNETDNLTGITNENVTPPIKQYEGFTSPETQEITINPDGSTTVDYYYTRNSYSVTLVAGTGISEVNGEGIYKYGQSVTINAITKIGYTWSNWSNEILNETHTFTIGAENVTLTATAKANKYTISYDCNGGINTTQSSNHTYDIEEKLTENSCLNPGYVFTGWKDSNENKFTDKQIVKNLTPTNNGVVSLIAQWEPIEYILSYNVNGGNCILSDMTIKYNETTILPSCTREGYTFINWLSSKDNEYPSGTTINGLSTESGEKVLMTAQWIANDYMLTLDGNSATKLETTTVTATYDSPLPSITNPSREYKVTFDSDGGSVSPSSLTATYVFNGYYYNGTQYYKADGTSATTWNVTNDVTLIASWTESSVTLPTPTKTGYKFEGWYTSTSGGTKVGNGGTIYIPTSEITLYARWSVNTYKLTLDGNGATKSGTTSVTATYDSALPSITKPEKSYNVTFNANGGSVSSSNLTATHIFNGYYYNSTQYYKADGTSARTWNVDSDVKLTANWTSKSITLPTPTRTMYTFNGWYTAASGGTKIGDGGSTYTPTNEIMLYAQWTAKAPVITTSGNLATFSYQSAYYPSCGLIQAIPHYTVTYHAEGYSTITIDTVQLYGGDWYYKSGISKNPSSSSTGATMYFYINGTTVSGSVSGTVSKGSWITTNLNKSVTISHTTAKSISIWWAMTDMTLGDVGMWYQGNSTESVGTTTITLNVP